MRQIKRIYFKIDLELFKTNISTKILNICFPEMCLDIFIENDFKLT